MLLPSVSLRLAMMQSERVAAAEDVRISLRVGDAGLDVDDLLSTEASRCSLMLGPGETRADRTFQLRDWSGGGRSPRSSWGSHWRRTEGRKRWRLRQSAEKALLRRRERERKQEESGGADKDKKRNASPNLASSQRAIVGG